CRSRSTPGTTPFPYTTLFRSCDLIVGTEEEVLIAAGQAGLHDALRTIRSLSSATIVLKRGPMGCIVYDGAIPDDLEQGIVGKGLDRKSTRLNSSHVKTSYAVF